MYIGIVNFDRLLILKKDTPLPGVDETQAIDSCLGFDEVVPVVVIALVGSFDEVVADGRVVAYLLAINFGSVTVLALKGFAEDGVQLRKVNE